MHTTKNCQQFLVPDDDASASYDFLFLLDWDDYEVLPCVAVSPARMNCLQGFGLSDNLGLRLRVTGPKVSVLAHGARHAFWRMPMTQLDKACADLGLKPKDKSVLELVKTLIKRAIADIGDEELLDLLQQRGVPPEQTIPEELTEELVEELAGKEEAEAIHGMYA